MNWKTYFAFLFVAWSVTSVIQLHTTMKLIGTVEVLQSFATTEHRLLMALSDRFAQHMGLRIPSPPRIRVRAIEPALDPGRTEGLRHPAYDLVDPAWPTPQLPLATERKSR